MPLLFASQIIESGQARCVDYASDKIDEVPIRKGMFVKQMPSPYELALRQSRPVAYWQLGRGEENYVDNMLGNRYLGKYADSVQKVEIGADPHDGRIPG